MTKPTLPHLPQKTKRHVVNKQPIVGVLGYTQTEVIEILQCLELGIRFEKDAGFPISILKAQLAKKFRALLISTKGEGV